jgi:hypothetical protein
VAYPIDLIQDENREILRRQTLGMSANLNALSRQEQATGAALANMFATGEKMRQQDEADLYRQQVMEQRQRGQQASLEARALEAQRGREFRSLEAGKARQFQKSMQRRRLGSGRKAARVEKDMQRMYALATDTEQAPGSAVRNEKLAQSLAKGILKRDPGRREEVESILGSFKFKVGIAHTTTGSIEARRTSAAQQNINSRRSAVTRLLAAVDKARNDSDNKFDNQLQARLATQATEYTTQLAALDEAAFMPTPQMAPPQTAPGAPLQPGQSKPVPVGVRNSFPANVEFEIPGIGWFIHDGQTLRRER